MATLESIARPYARAAFNYARDNKQLLAWKNFLEAAACVAKDPVVIRILTTPEIAVIKVLDLFQGVLAKLLDGERKNFLLLLAQNNRLLVLPEISDLFNSYYSSLEKISKVRVVTAVAAQTDFQQKLAQALTKRLQHDVTLQCEIDPAIIGGAIIYMNDSVIDGSVRGQLTRLLDYSLR